MDFSNKPVVLFFETTRACLLSCKHCRAKAQKLRDPDELSLDQIDNVIEQIKEFGKPYPIVILTGGDPLMRPDIFEIIEKFSNSGIKVSVAFSGTKLANEKVIRKFKDLNVLSLSISIDGSAPEVHDEFRGVKGTFETSMDILQNCKKQNLSFQINTTVGKYNLYDLPALLRLAMNSGAKKWDLFFIIATGRASKEQSIDAEEAEQVLSWLALVEKRISMNIKVTEAPFYNRIKESGQRYNGKIFEYLYSQTEDIMSMPELKKLVVRKDFKNLGVVDGRGIMFISHTGEVYPSGFLPLCSGSVKHDRLVQIYDHSTPFKSIKSPDNLKGKCRNCDYKYTCSGSRARAYAEYGDYLESDPLCVYNSERRI